MPGDDDQGVDAASTGSAGTRPAGDSGASASTNTTGATGAAGATSGAADACLGGSRGVCNGAGRTKTAKKTISKPTHSKTDFHSKTDHSTPKVSYRNIVHHQSTDSYAHAKPSAP